MGYIRPRPRAWTNIYTTRVYVLTITCQGNSPFIGQTCDCIVSRKKSKSRNITLFNFSTWYATYLRSSDFSHDSAFSSDYGSHTFLASV